MTAVAITAIVVVGVIVLAAMDHYFGLRRKELETKLRIAEMDAGVPPGTYSRMSRKEMKQARKAMEDSGWSPKAEAGPVDEETERENLMRGIDDLKSRIDNIDTIMAAKKGKAGEERK